MVGFDCKVKIHMNDFSIFTDIVCFNNFATPVSDFVGFDGQLTILPSYGKSLRLTKVTALGIAAPSGL